MQEEQEFIQELLNPKTQNQAFEKLLNSNAERRNLNLRFWFHQIGSENLDYKALRSDGYKYVYKLGRFIELNTTENEN